MSKQHWALAGRNVIIHQKGKNPIISKDGVTISRFVEFEDPFENAAAMIIKQAAEQTNKQAGDGTTTATVLSHAILMEARKHIAAGVSPIDLKRGIDKCAGFLSDKLLERARPLKSQSEIEKIATISANGDEVIGKMIARAVDLVGKDGSILVREGGTFLTSLELVEGFRFDAGFASSQFITNERKGIMFYDDPYILVTDHRIDLVAELMPVLEIAAKQSKPLIIVSEEIEGQALAALIANSLRGTMAVAAVNAPRYGDERKNFLEDLAIATGATLITRISGLSLKTVKIKDLGNAKSIECSKTHTTITGGKGLSTQIKDRVDVLKELLTNTEDLKQCEKIQERISRLVGGIAIISVGANTEVEMVEKKHRIDDALEAVKSAIEEGIIPGGGSMLAKLAHEYRSEIKPDFDSHKYGIEILLKACEIPLKTIIENAGGKPDLVLAKVLDSSDDMCYDAVTENMVDAFVNGIIDPVKVTRCALKNAASAAGILITIDHAIIEV